MHTGIAIYRYQNTYNANNLVYVKACSSVSRGNGTARKHLCFTIHVLIGAKSLADHDVALPYSP